MSTLSRQKELGAFYTADAAVHFLVRWACPQPGLAVMDPSCGDGRFLVGAAACGAQRLIGCDLDPSATAVTRARLSRLPPVSFVHQCDFFSLDPAVTGQVDAVVGNPPFIRYQRFRGETRARALASARRLGVELTRLASSWAPFLLHSVHFVAPGGRLAMVVPAEAVQTQYGWPTVQAIAAHFSRVRLVTFERNWFDGAQTEACLLLAEGRGGAAREVEMVLLGGVEDLAAERLGMDAATNGGVLRLEGHSRYAEVFLSPAEREAFTEVCEGAGVRTIGMLGVLANGYVSGANGFFHRTAEAAAAAGLPADWLVPTARNSRSLLGLEFTAADVAVLESRHQAHHLVIPRDDLFSSNRAALAQFVAEGVAAGVHRRYKCRTRQPWWRVPGLIRADLLLSYMIGERPRAAVNRCEAFYTNALHGLRTAPGIAAEQVALAFHSTLTLLSIELEGRSYGGGILKLEPTEMQRVVIPWVGTRADLSELARGVDVLLRAGRYRDAVAMVDDVYLRSGLGLDVATLALLESGCERLRRRRLERSRRRGGES